MRIIEVVTDCGHADTLCGIGEHHGVLDRWIIPAVDEQSRCTVRLLVQPEKQQSVIDAIQQALEKIEATRIIISPVEATLPRPAADEEEKARSVTRTREELYSNVESGTKLDSNYLIMVVISTIVAAIGLLEDNVAVVIGAMVIAPLLGPNLALAFSAALGDSELAFKSLKAGLSGILLALLVALVIGLLWPLNFNSQELLSRTDVGLDSIALALASGAAAVFALVAPGWSSVLVGVMVAVALLPPTAALGLMLGAGKFQLALGAALLLAVNIVSVNLSAKLAFILKGVRPRTWLEKQKAKQSMRTYIIFWIVALVILIGVMQIHHHYLDL